MATATAPRQMIRVPGDDDFGDPAGFTAGWLAALVYAGEESMFLPERWRD